VRYYYLAGSTGIGAAGGGFGNNMILRRSSLDAAGGYDAVAESPTEDAALVSAVRRAGFAVRAGCLPDLFVWTAAESSWRALVKQTLRWNNGGLFSPDPLTRLNFGMLMVMISLGMLCIPLLPFFPFLWPFSVTVLFTMAMNTIAVLAVFNKKDPAGRSGLPTAGLRYLLQWPFTPAFMTLLTVLGFAGVRPKWER
jgi:cellulose synthase/poly-beta-1,6-N-acetylglucosamine synthase-like glycosyltransferase